MSEANWYVVHTYSGYENKVKTTIEQTIENRNCMIKYQKYQYLHRKLSNLKNGVKKSF